MDIRLITTGHDADGRSIVLSDRPVAPITVAMLPGAEIHRLYELDEPPRLPATESTGRPTSTFFPGPGGLRFGVLTVPAGFTYDPPDGLDLAAAAEEVATKLPGMLETFDPEAAGMHTTVTVDFLVCVSGRGRMLTDGGVEVRLRRGDCLVQNGTAHAWYNDGDEPFSLVFTLCGAVDGGG